MARDFLSGEPGFWRRLIYRRWTVRRMSDEELKDQYRCFSGDERTWRSVQARAFHRRHLWDAINAERECNHLHWRMAVIRGEYRRRLERGKTRQEEQVDASAGG